MSFFHAVLLIDHHTAKVLQFDAEQVEIETVFEKTVYTRQHNSQVRTEHEFFTEVCNALAGITEILVVGSHMAQADFRRNIEKHHASVAKRVVGWETVDHPTDAQLVAFARHYFIDHEREAESPPSHSA
jgi:stalled ribosome rescue protein Dom34